MTQTPADAQPAEERIGDGNLLLLIDPTWEPTDEAPEPPVKALLGAWVVTEGEVRSRFQANPIYEPSSPDSPLDPVDAVLRLLSRGEGDDGELASLLATVLRDVMLCVALDDRGVALVQPAPDGVPSVLVTTAPGHRRRLDVPGWLDVTVEQLAEALPARGVDVLFNPRSPVSMRVRADAVRDAAQGSDD
jgi:hypothetical protein